MIENIKEETKHKSIIEWLHNRLTVSQYDYHDLVIEAAKYMSVSEVTIKRDLGIMDFSIPLSRKHMWVNFINKVKKEWKLKTSLDELFPTEKVD